MQYRVSQYNYCLGTSINASSYGTKVVNETLRLNGALLIGYANDAMLVCGDDDSGLSRKKFDSGTAFTNADTLKTLTNVSNCI